MMCSSWARTCSEVDCLAIGSIHTDRPSLRRRGPVSVGSRSTHSASTVSTAASRAVAHVVASCPGCGDTVSQSWRRTSMRFHADCRAANDSTTSLAATGDGSSGCWWA